MERGVRRGARSCSRGCCNEGVVLRFDRRGRWSWGLKRWVRKRWLKRARPRAGQAVAIPTSPVRLRLVLISFEALSRAPKRRCCLVCSCPCRPFLAQARSCPSDGATSARLVERWSLLPANEGHWRRRTFCVRRPAGGRASCGVADWWGYAISDCSGGASRTEHPFQE